MGCVQAYIPLLIEGEFCHQPDNDPIPSWEAHRGAGWYNKQTLNISTGIVCHTHAHCCLFPLKNPLTFPAPPKTIHTCITF